MKASEARQLAKMADEVTKEAENEQYAKIMDNILKAIRKDECYSIWWYSQISARLMSRLENDGYKVTNVSNWKDGTMYEISWAE